MSADDPHDLQRFLDAQQGGDTYAQALAELGGGRKRTHWIWFVFPQIAGLGMSQTSQTYAIASLEEARAYLAHPLLGARLRESAAALLAVESGSAEQILGPVDAVKVRSSMTLFAAAAPGEPSFREVLDRFYDGEPDPETLARI